MFSNISTLKLSSSFKVEPTSGPSPMYPRRRRSSQGRSLSRRVARPSSSPGIGPNFIMRQTKRPLRKGIFGTPTVPKATRSPRDLCQRLVIPISRVSSKIENIFRGNFRKVEQLTIRRCHSRTYLRAVDCCILTICILTIYSNTFHSWMVLYQSWA